MVKVLNDGRQVRLGAVLSYVLILFNAVYGLFLTPFIIGQVGEAAFGVYKTVSAFTASMMVLDLGLGGTIMRYVSKYRADNEEEKIPNFICMGLIQTGALCALVGIVTTILYFFLDVIYRNGLTAIELENARVLYIFLAFGIVAHMFENFLNGIISGYNKFIFANGIKLIRLIARIVLVVLFLSIFKNTLVLVVVDLTCTLFFIFAELAFLSLHLKVKIKYTHWEGDVFKESFRYTILMFLTSLVAQANSNIPNILIGALINSTAVTIYSMAVLFFGMFEQLSSAISGIMLPTVMETLKGDDANFTNTKSVVIKAGRVQFLLLGAVFVGFLILGRHFIEIWLGNGYEDVYFLVMILLGPALLELCINVCLSILRAKNIIGFRTVVVVLSSVFNVAISVLSMNHIGYYAAAIGTACSFLFGSVITMGIYFYKVLKINILNLYRNIFHGIWICIILGACAAALPIYLIDSVFWAFIFGFISFVVIYAATLLAFGLNKNEKTIIFNMFRRKKT